MILTIEDNYGGGLGAAVAEAVAEDGGGFRVEQLYVKDIPKSGLTPDCVLRAAGIDAEAIAKKAMSMLSVVGV